ncbi:tRNA (C5-cytosine) methyltransferase NCL1 [Penicillium canescens]|nr:tRNA (C5-cytosine) methyltransferase NCL1 [Penicillium canescens]KAJ6098296.1 tRNA (C5-cytosine) methyltransferase NCL1 [Penicillium canescens]KAJ6166285.1 tRNA (C5-cytosine) methyltransferase NCL1 [Penicillium canescens]
MHRVWALFGNGEETVQFVEPFDRVAVLQCLEPWKRTVDDDTESVADFLLRIENVHRWLAEMLMA